MGGGGGGAGAWRRLTRDASALGYGGGEVEGRADDRGDELASCLVVMCRLT